MLTGDTYSYDLTSVCRLDSGLDSPLVDTLPGLCSLFSDQSDVSVSAHWLHYIQGSNLLKDLANAGAVLID